MVFCWFLFGVLGGGGFGLARLVRRAHWGKRNVPTVTSLRLATNRVSRSVATKGEAVEANNFSSAGTCLHAGVRYMVEM